MGTDWDNAATLAVQDLHARFGHRLMGLPGTWIGSLEALAPSGVEADRNGIRKKFTTPFSEWHYWWQAQYLDAICDAGFGLLRQGRTSAALAEVRRGEDLLRGIWIRNFGRFPNYFYDDMAWLALSSARLNDLSFRLRQQPARMTRRVQASLTKQLYRARDGVLGDGLYWSRKRQFKNTPVNAPAALHFARSEDQATARQLVAWLRRKLFDTEHGLYLDGIHLTHAGLQLDRRIFTYNQGPIIGVLLELGEPTDLKHIAELVESIAAQLAAPGKGIRLEQGGDGNLFTGILCRYLTLAACDQRLSTDTRAQATRLVLETAEALRDQAEERLSGAIQRYMVLQAAAELNFPHNVD